MSIVPVHGAILRHALLVCILLVLAPAAVAIWATTTIDESEVPPRWMTDEQARRNALWHDENLQTQDLRKPRARGEFGPFLAVGEHYVSESPSRERCDVQTSYGIGRGGLTLDEVLSSPLAIPEFSPEGVIAGACDGVVISVSGGWIMPTTFGDEMPQISIFLIGYLPIVAEWRGAADRTELGEMDGYPALIEHPIPGLITNNIPRMAFILFTEPKDDKPGIGLLIQAASLEEAAGVVISSLEKRVGEMGVPPNPYN